MNSEMSDEPMNLDMSCLSAISNAESSNELDTSIDSVSSTQIQEETIRRQSDLIGALRTELIMLQITSEERIRILKNHNAAYKIRTHNLLENSKDLELCSLGNLESAERKRQADQQYNERLKSEHKSEMESLRQQLNEVTAKNETLSSLFILASSTLTSTSVAPLSASLLSSSASSSSKSLPSYSYVSPPKQNYPNRFPDHPHLALSSVSSTHVSTIHVSDFHAPPLLHIPQPPPPPGRPPLASLASTLLSTQLSTPLLTSTLSASKSSPPSHTSTRCSPTP